MYKMGERRRSGSAVTSGACDKLTGRDLGLNYKAGTAGAELPYKAAIAFDDPRLGRPLALARPQLANVPGSRPKKLLDGGWSSSYLAKVGVDMMTYYRDFSSVTKRQLGALPFISTRFLARHWPIGSLPSRQEADSYWLDTGRVALA